MMTLAKPICSLISGSYDFASYSSSFWVLIILASMMLTYSLAEMIYGQILLPMKKEKYYLSAIVAGVILNIVLSIILGGFVFKEHPAIGVAIGTVTTDILIFVYLIIITWKWVYKALFNVNTIKLVVSSLIVLGLSIGLSLGVDVLFANFVMSQTLSLLLKLVIVFVIDMIVYIGVLLLMKEDLVFSFIKRTPKQI